MVRSMTGYGRAAGVSGNLELEIELKAVNNRYLDVSIRLPRRYLFVEDSLKKRVGQAVLRGKVDVFVNVDSAEDPDVAIAVNEPLARAYIEALRTLVETFGLKDDVSALGVGKLQDVLQVERKEADTEAIAKDLLGILEEALEAFHEMRCTEGEKLRQDILERLDRIELLRAQVAERSPQTVAAYRARLTQRMTEALESVPLDESRILTEAAIFADRVAVDEETTRLKSHIAQIRETLQSGEAVGRKLDFLLQETYRETNTIGSKCNDLELGKVVIDLKAEIEKIREQVQNIE